MSVVDHPRQAKDFVLVRYDKVLKPTGAKITFGRAERFQSPKRCNVELNCTLPSTLTSRGTDFGFGTKFKNFRANQNQVSPVSYKLPSWFDTFVVEKNKPTSFGAGREAFENVSSYNPRPPVDPEFPGPGFYDELKKEDCKFTMAGKNPFNDFFSAAARRDYPGPGEYNDTQQLNNKGSYYNSELA